jgi:nucleoside-triphosphatase THEP1
MEKHYSRAVLLTGRRGVGKTTVCQAVAELARRRGYQPGGVITPALYDHNGAKIGFEAMDVGSGERWPLARTDIFLPPMSGGDRGGGSGHRQELGSLRVGHYSFDPNALARVLKVLKRACPEPLDCARDKLRRRAATAGCDLLMVDEIGPLELEQGEGFAPILDLLPVEEKASPGAKTTHTLIVVRPALVEKLCQRLDGIEFVVFHTTEENRDELPRRIVERLWGDG